MKSGANLRQLTDDLIICGIRADTMDHREREFAFGEVFRETFTVRILFVVGASSENLQGRKV